jgi:hypothetical protein
MKQDKEELEDDSIAQFISEPPLVAIRKPPLNPSPNVIYIPEENVPGELQVCVREA